MQYEKIARLAEVNYGENSTAYLQSLFQYTQIQISYNVGTLSEMLANASRLVQLSAGVYKDKESEIQRVPLINLLFEVQMKSKQVREAVTTME